MEITASMVKELRESTGAGMMDCKKALVEANGDMEAAVDVLRTKGLAALAKKAGRATNEGLIGGIVAEDGRTASVLEVNCETDFVARNANFKELVTELAQQVLESAPVDVDDMLAQPYVQRPEITVEERLGEAVSKLGENMGIARLFRYELSTEAGCMAVYIHGIGNIGVLVEVSTGTPEAAAHDAVRGFAKDVAMQIAAAAPIAIHRDEVASDVVEHEMNIYRNQAAETGKPEPIQQKIAEGRLEKFFKEFCLLEQQFVKNPDITVKQHAQQAGKEAGASVDVVRFVRLVLGETNPEPKSSCCC
ncbi:MAG: translation elongation factor Ts [Coriobacteriia bacterium]|nr:translation elongation factor Ts [Coriobacteriia bacterium]